MPSPEQPSTLKAPPAQLDLPGLEEGILALWAERDVEGLEVSDRIALTLTCSGELAAVAGDPGLAEMIKGETLSVALEVKGDGEGDERFEIDGEGLAVAVTRQG